MSETVVTIEDAARCLPELVERVHNHGEAAILVKSGRVLARIVPASPPERATEELITFLRRWRHEHPEPDELFGPDIEQSRISIQPPHDPWQ